MASPALKVCESGLQVWQREEGEGWVEGGTESFPHKAPSLSLRDGVSWL